MPHRITISARDLLPLDQQCIVAQRWIVPGDLSLDFLLIQLTIEPTVRAMTKLVEQLQEHHAEWEGTGPTRRKKVKIHFRPGTTDRVGEEIIMKDPDAFTKAYDLLMSRDFTIEIPHWITPDHFKRFKDEMVDNTAGLVPPYAAAFGPVMEQFHRPTIAPAAAGPALVADEPAPPARARGGARGKP